MLISKKKGETEVSPFVCITRMYSRDNLIGLEAVSYAANVHGYEFTRRDTGICTS